MAVGALMALALVTRTYGHLDEAVWEDEVGAMHVIELPSLSGALRQIVTHESTPPAYYVVARFVDQAFGWMSLDSQVRVLRVLSILFATGCVALTFVIARRLLELSGAILAALLAGLASILVIHGSELRAYPLLALVATAFAFQLPRALETLSSRDLALLAGVVAIGGLTHYFFLLTLAAGVLWLVLERPTSEARKRVGIALALGLVPLVLWSPAWLYQFRHGIFATAPPFSLDRFSDVVTTLMWPQALSADVGSFGRSLVTIAILAPALLLLRRRDGRLAALMLLVPLLCSAFVAWSTGERIFSVRNLTAVAPFVAIVVAWACVSLPRRTLAAGAAGLALASVFFGYGYSELRLGRTPYDRVARELRAQRFRDDEPIVWFGDKAGVGPVAWYLTARGSRTAWPKYVLARPSGGVCRAVQVIARTRAGRLWLHAHADRVLAETHVKSYGDGIQGRRGSDISVARLSWTNDVLGSTRSGGSRVVFHLVGTRPPCLRDP